MTFESGITNINKNAGFVAIGTKPAPANLGGRVKPGHDECVVCGAHFAAAGSNSNTTETFALNAFSRAMISTGPPALVSTRD